jgi:hypothetical protein
VIGAFQLMTVLVQESQTMFAAGYLIIPFVVLVIVIVYVFLRGHFKNRHTDAVIEPFEDQST